MPSSDRPGRRRSLATTSFRPLTGGLPMKRWPPVRIPRRSGSRCATPMTSRRSCATACRTDSTSGSSRAVDRMSLPLRRRHIGCRGAAPKGDRQSGTRRGVSGISNTCTAKVVPIPGNHPQSAAVPGGCRCRPLASVSTRNNQTFAKLPGARRVSLQSADERYGVDHGGTGS